MGDYVVVANSTPIILFHNIGYLHLLKTLYGKIYIPRAVYNEVAADFDFISPQKWIKVIEIQNKDLKRLLQINLHVGEVEAIILSTEMPADLLILDDLLARKHAKVIGINITGTLGILLALKHKGIIHAVKPLMEQLINVGMYIDKKLYEDVLAMAKE